MHHGKNATGCVVKNIFHPQYHINEQHTEWRTPVKYRFNVGQKQNMKTFILYVVLLN
jgi:hypothetical protein